MKATSQRGNSHRGQARTARNLACRSLQATGGTLSSGAGRLWRCEGRPSQADRPLPRIVTEAVRPLSSPHYALTPPLGLPRTFVAQGYLLTAELLLDKDGIC